MPDDTPAPDRSELSEQFILRLNAVHGRLLGFLRVMLGNGTDAEDVLQRASITMWRKFAEFDQTQDFFSWSSSFAFYEAKNFQRTAARSRLHFDDALMNRLAEERAPDLEHRDVRLAAMDRCIEELDTPSRDLVREFYLNNADIATLAQQQGRAPQTLYNKLNALRRLLGDCMKRRLAQEA
ncbi:MAG TPA: sigma-70 family RNA polymerase sigma factor [Candidatus Saccharimonadia bacterium]|nr:sigma-70 family RNA polymerase sigma factor [Candidatus Saccharimonadia bacterium]